MSDDPVVDAGHRIARFGGPSQETPNLTGLGISPRSAKRRTVLDKTPTISAPC